MTAETLTPTPPPPLARENDRLSFTLDFSAS